MVKGKIPLLALISMIVVSIDNIRNLPSIAIYGDQIIQLYSLVGLFFFVPCGLATMMLALTFPKYEGGVYYWISQAFGYNAGFMAMWLQWVENVVWFPSIVAFIAAALAHMFYFSINPIYLAISVPAIFWISTWINLKGIELTAKLSSYCTILGLFFPLSCLIIFALVMPEYTGTYNNQQVFDHLFDFHTFKSLDYSAIGIMCLSLAGIEITAVHVTNIYKPQRFYTIAILVAMFIIITTLTLGSFSILSLIPLEKINFIDSILHIFRQCLAKLGILYLEPIFAFTVLLGSFGGLINWIIAPVRGLMVSAKHGYLPKFMLNENKYSMPVTMLYIQAIIVTLLSLIFLIFDTANQSYWILTIIPAGLYLMMYIMLFSAYIKLAYEGKIYKFKKKTLNHIILLFIISGLIFSIFAIYTVFIPPELVFKKQFISYSIMILLSLVVFLSPALYCMVYKYDKC